MYEQQIILILDQSMQGNQKQCKILLSRDEQLHNEFLDLFTKHVVNSTQSVFFDHFGKEKSRIPYGEVHKFLKAHPQQDRLKLSNRLNPTYSPFRQKSINKSFAFQASNSSLTLLLDLSPYMLNYDYQSKSSPLINMQMVVKDLLGKIRQKKEELVETYIKMQNQYPNYNWNVEFTLSVYTFSVYESNPVIILYRQDVNYTSLALLQQFIINAIHKSTLPYKKPQKKEVKSTIGEIIQVILDTEEPLLGIRSILVISSFSEKEKYNKIFFTSNWYTYGFVNVGGHLGSCLVQEKQILQRYGSSTFFQIKYVFTCKFIENWQKVDKIENQKNTFLTLKTEKHRTIVYFSEGTFRKNIFDELLQFKLELKNKITTNSMHDFANSVDPSLKGFQLPKKEYRISEWNFNFILRTRYQQGWQPIIHEKKGDRVVKCVFKLQFSPQIYLIYKAQLVNSNQGPFYYIQIGSKLNNEANLRKCKPNFEGFEVNINENLFDLIENIDLICTSQFKSIHTRLLDEKGLKRKQYLSPFSISEESQTKSLNYVLQRPGSWGKFSKLKYLYFIFYPGINRVLYQEFLNEISFFIGQKATQSSRIFMKKGWVNDDKNQKRQHKIQFSQLMRNKNMLKLKLGYVNYTFKQIKQVLEPFMSKFQYRKFKSGEVMMVYDELFKFNDEKEISFQKMFQNKWKLKIQDPLAFKSFQYYFKATLKNQGFQETGEKRIPTTIKYYAKRILINQAKQDLESNIKQDENLHKIQKQQKSIEKTIFCTVEFLPGNQMIFSFQMFPLIGKLIPFEQEQILVENQRSMSLPQLHEFKPKQQVSAFDFFSKFTENFRYTQVKIMKIIHTYNQIHEALILKLMQQKMNKKHGLGFSKNLKNLIKQLYPQAFKGVNFQAEYEALCQVILATYYIKESDKKKKSVKEDSIDIDFIPEPRKHFITADVDEIKGDMTLKKNGKEYKFFLFSPYHPIYISKRGNKFYYKSINLMYEDINIQQGDPANLQRFISEISNIILKEEYRKLYSEFFTEPSNFIKGKNVEQHEGQQKKIEKQSVQLEKFIRKIEKFNPPTQSFLNLIDAITFFGVKLDDKTSKNPKDEIDEKLNPIIKEFVSIYFELISIFFEPKVEKYLFQRSHQIETLSKYSLQEQKMKDFNQLIIKNYFKINVEEIPITQSNFASLIYQYKNEIVANKAKIVFLCYSQLHDENKKNNESFEYFLQTMQKLCLEFAKQLQRVKITKVNDLQTLRQYDPIKFFNKETSLPFDRFYDKLSTQKISRYVESTVTQKLIPLKKIPNQIYRYLCAKQTKTSIDKNIIESIPFWLHLQISDTKIIILYYEYQFFTKGQKIETKIKKFIQDLINFVNCDILIWEMFNTRELPLQPHELYVSPLVNNMNNKLVQTKKKNVQKKGLKGIRGRIQSQRRQTVKLNLGQDSSQDQTHPVPLLNKGFVLLNQRFKNGQGIEAIKKYQNFQIFQIINLKNTYMFPTSYDESKDKENLIFHFDQEDFEKISKDISSKQISQFNGKPKRVLVFYVHGLNATILKSQSYNFICSSIKDAINLKVFQILSHELFILPELIQPIEENELKRGHSLQFSFQIPFIPFIDDFRGYLKQHISMYHTKTEFKSQRNKNPPKNLYDEESKLDRTESLSVKRSFAKLNEPEIKEKTLNMSQSHQFTVFHNHGSSFVQSTKQSCNSLSFVTCQERRRGLSIGRMEQLECERCIPTMWLFNYKKNTKLESKFGKCIYLLKIETQHTCSIAENAKIWERLMGNRRKKSYIGCGLQESQRIRLKEYLFGTKPLNSKVDPDENNFKTIITFNVLHILGHPINNAMEEVFLSTVRTSVSDYYIEKYLNFFKIKQNEEQTFSLKRTDERLLFSKQSMGVEYGLEDLGLIKNKSQITQSMIHDKSTQNNISIDLTESCNIQIKDTDIIETEKLLFKRTIDRKEIELKKYKQILHLSQSIDTIIGLSANQSLFKVLTNQEVLMKNIKTYFKDFYEYFNKLLEQSSRKNLFFIYYIQWKNNFKKEPIFFLDEIQNGSREKIEQKVKNLTEKLEEYCPDSILNEIKRFGFIINDQFYQEIQTIKINGSSNYNPLEQSLISNKLKIINLEEIDRCKIFTQDRAFCLAQYLFSRSLYVHYEISYEGFKYYSYNLNIFINNQIGNFLHSLQVWIQEKDRLLKFIRGIKEKGIYECPPYKNKKIAEKFGFIYELYLETLKGGKKQEDDKRIKSQELSSQSLSKILLALVFYEYPLKYRDGTLMNLSKQIQQIYELLKASPIDYKEFPQYKGKQKFLLQKLGRQYISILKVTYGSKLADRNLKQSTDKLKSVSVN